jgi:hypothetical protein
MKNTVYEEAMRYMANAKETLKTAGKEDGLYQDIKYVRTASGTAYNGVLMAVDEILLRKEGAKFKKPKSIEEYRTRLGKIDRKMLALLNATYDALHLAGYYHGTTSEKTISHGMKDAQAIIEYIR